MSGGDDGGVDLWRVAVEDNGKQIQVLHEGSTVLHSDLVTSVACSKSSSSSGDRLFASSSSDGTAVVWGAGNGCGEFRMSAVPQGRSPMNHVCWSYSDRGRIVTASDDGVVRLWGESTSKPCLSLNAHGPAMCSLCLDGNYVAVGTELGDLILFDVRNPGEKMRQVDKKRTVLTHQEFYVFCSGY